jgi:hypothetical protein
VSQDSGCDDLLLGPGDVKPASSQAMEEESEAAPRAGERPPALDDPPADTEAQLAAPADDVSRAQP